MSIIEDKMKERHELLIRMRDSLQEELVACDVGIPEQEGAPEVLNVILDVLGGGESDEGAIGEFYFDTILSEKEEIQRFTGAVTIMDILPEEHLAELYEAMSYINFRLPGGCYSIDKDKTYLAFRLTTPLPAELSGDALYDQMNVCVSNTVAIADLYMEQLIQLAIGKITVEDIKNLLD